jgi:hypothetical protein
LNLLVADRQGCLGLEGGLGWAGGIGVGAMMAGEILVCGNFGGFSFVAVVCSCGMKGEMTV